MKVKNWIELTVITIVAYALLTAFDIGCPILYLSGISCLGCGMTRAWLHLIKLDFSMALYYHPLFWLPPIGFLGLLLKKRIPKKLYTIGMYVIIISFIIVYILRFFHKDDTIVRANLKESAILKILNFILER